MIGYFYKAIRPLVLIMPKMSGYVKKFKAKEEDNSINVYLLVGDKKYYL